MTLLTPAVLHCSALEHIKDESPKFHKKYTVQFALVQGFWAVILYFICFSAIFLPKVSQFREVGDKVLTNANFTTVSIKEDVMTIDIKPEIWAFTIDDSLHLRNEFVIDSTGKMNRFYWDDRTEKGEVKRLNGVGLTRDWLLIKQGTRLSKVPYHKLTMGKELTMTKGEVHSLLLKSTDKALLLKKAVLLSPLVFLIGAIFGFVMHIGYIGIIGSLLVLLTQKFSRSAAHCYKLASALYVGWAYILVLTMIGQQFMYITFGNISHFFLAIKIILFVALVLVGYLCFQSFEENEHKVAVAKLSRKSR